jgi:predicted transcriptional regulator
MGNKELSPSEIKQLKAQLKNQSNVIDAINNTTKIRILLLLWIYKEQSIKGLCAKLGKSRPTVTGHLEGLDEAGLLEKHEEKSRGKYNRKIFSVRPNIIEATRLGFDFLKLPPDDIIEILSHDLKSDAKTIEIIKKILKDLPPYYEELERKLHELTPTRENLEDFYFRKHVNYYVELLDEEEFEFYFEKYRELLKDLANFRKERKKPKKPTKTDKHYTVLDIILPIKEIQEARFKRFWRT